MKTLILTISSIFLLGMVSDNDSRRALERETRTHVVVIDTVYMFQYDTIRLEVVYDSSRIIARYMKAYIETESRNYEKMRRGFELKPNPVSSGGVYKGLFQMGEKYLERCDLCQVLNWGIDDMFDPKKAVVAKIVKDMAYIKRFETKYGILPTQEELARIHAAGFSKARNNSITKYTDYFLTQYNQELGDRDFDCSKYCE